MKTTFIYVIIDPRYNTKIYIGKSNNPISRYNSHINETSKNKKTKKCNWLRKIKSCGLSPILEILDEVYMDNWEFWERYYIQQFADLGFDLINVRPGGNGISFHTNDTKYKLSQGRLGEKRKPYSDEHRRKISEGRLKISNKLRRHHTDDEKYKISKGLTEAYMNGKRIPAFLGKKFTDTHKKKISESNKKIVYQCDLQGNIIKEWSSAMDAHKQLGLSASSIGKCCMGKAHSCGGFTWIYKQIR